MSWNCSLASPASDVSGWFSLARTRYFCLISSVEVFGPTPSTLKKSMVLLPTLCILGPPWWGLPAIRRPLGAPARSGRSLDPPTNAAAATGGGRAPAPLHAPRDALTPTPAPHWKACPPEPAPAARASASNTLSSNTLFMLAPLCTDPGRQSAVAFRTPESRPEPAPAPQAATGRGTVPEFRFESRLRRVGEFKAPPFSIPTGANSSEGSAPLQALPSRIHAEPQAPRFKAATGHAG
mmetsp:Transcript_267/g.603  ORF Transcript_267/g.603 Transcript_267/m.603 type:complete len:237 (-) Transcript_267:131-841(-)